MPELDTHSLLVGPDQPLIGVIVKEDGHQVWGGHQVVRYFTEETEADAALRKQGGRDVRRPAGVSSDLDWDIMVSELDRIRHESRSKTI